MRLRGAIKQLEVNNFAGTVIPNVNPLEYDDESETYFAFKNVNLPVADLSYLIAGVQVFFLVTHSCDGVEAINITPATVGRYRAKCALPDTRKVFISDLQITAEISENSSFELGGADNIFPQDEILVLLTWAEIVESQRDLRMPTVDACGTLMARGYPFLTSAMKRSIVENRQSRVSDADQIDKPFDKLSRAPTVEDLVGTSCRRRLRSFNGTSSPVGFNDAHVISSNGMKPSYSASPYHAHPLAPVAFSNNFHNPQIHAPNFHFNGHACSFFM